MSRMTRPAQNRGDEVRRLPLHSVSMFFLPIAMAWAGGGITFAKRPIGFLVLVLWGIWSGALAMGRSTGAMSVHEQKQRFFLIAFGIVLLSVLIAAPWEYGHFSGPVPRDGALAWVGVLLLAAAAPLQIASVLALGRSYTRNLGIQPGHRLVTTGPYAIVRHPGYLSSFLGFLGTGLAMSSMLGLLAAVVTLPLMAYRIRGEEQMLVDAFGDEYRRYVAHTKRLLPFIY